MTKTPKVSVLLPVYNSEGFIEQSLLSILHQTYENIDVVVVDDGSTDNTAFIVSQLSKRYPNIVYRRKNNSGIVDTLNVAIDLASGQYLARQDADDISFPQRIEKQISFLLANSSVAAVGCRYYTIDEGGVFLSEASLNANRRFSDFSQYPALEAYLPHPFLMARGDLLRSLRYRHVLLAEDADLYWRLERYGELWNVDEILGAYRVHRSSLSGNVTNGRKQAVFSQLSAVSAARRQFGLEDLKFDRDWRDLCAGASSLKEVAECYKRFLMPHELSYFEAAAACKLLELTQYRPYKLTDDDLAYISSAVNSIKARNRASYKKNTRLLKRTYSKTYGLLGQFRHHYRRIFGGTV